MRNENLSESCPPAWGSRQTQSALVLIAITVLAYLPTFWAGFIWDDDDYVVENSTLLDTVGLVRIWTDPKATPQYYPLVHSTFWIEQHLWGLNPRGYHATNVLLHAMSVVCLWRLLQRWQVPGAWLCAAVFALHPVHVESVAWITERKNVLSGFWYLIAAGWYWNFAESVTGNSARDWGAATLGKYVFAFSAFVLAMLSKTVACSLPAAMLLILWWKRGTLRAVDWFRLIPFFFVGALFAWMTAQLERSHVGVERIQIGLSLADRFVLAGRAVWFYLGKLMWPTSLTFVYPKWSIRADEAVQWIGFGGASLLLAVLVRIRHSYGRGPLVAALFFGGTLLPALGFFDVFPMRYSFVADHFQYLASLGPIVLLVSSGWVSASKWLCVTSCARMVCAAMLLLLLGALTWRQSGIYRDLETLWRDTLAKNPAAAIAHNNLARILDDRGEIAEALALLKESVRIDPLPETRANYGLLLAKHGRFDEAIFEYRESLRVEPRSLAHAALARLLVQLGRHEEAQIEFSLAVALTPRDPDLRLQFAVSLMVSRKFEEALRQLDVVSVLARRHPRLWYVAGLIWLERDPPQAVTAFERAAELAPEVPGTFYRLGLAREKTGDFAGAAAAFRHALRLRSKFPEAQEALARVTKM